MQNFGAEWIHESVGENSLSRCLNMWKQEVGFTLSGDTPISGSGNTEE